MLQDLMVLRSTVVLRLVLPFLQEEIPRVQSDNIFNEIDMDGSGNIDKEEFLGWVFQTNSSFLSSVRRKLEVMPEAKVKALFEQMDKDENGCIDKEDWEFCSWRGEKQSFCCCSF